MIPLALLFTAPSAASFPYHGKAFDSFVRESYRVAGRKDPSEFYRTMDERAVKAGLPTWGAWAAANRPDGTAEGARTAGEAVW